jgi:hypothetical protein
MGHLMREASAETAGTAPAPSYVPPLPGSAECERYDGAGSGAVEDRYAVLRPLREDLRTAWAQNRRLIESWAEDRRFRTPLRSREPMLRLVRKRRPTQRELELFLRLVFREWHRRSQMDPLRELDAEPSWDWIEFKHLVLDSHRGGQKFRGRLEPAYSDRDIQNAVVGLVLAEKRAERAKRGGIARQRKLSGDLLAQRQIVKLKVWALTRHDIELRKHHCSIARMLRTGEFPGGKVAKMTISVSAATVRAVLDELYPENGLPV